MKLHQKSHSTASRSSSNKNIYLRLHWQHWRDLTEAAPVVVTCLLMPLTYSIAEGIALGFISYAAIKLLSGRGREVSVSVWVLSAIFIIKYLIS